MVAHALEVCRPDLRCLVPLTGCQVDLTLVGMGRTPASGRTNRVRPARQQAGLTQAELAVAAGVSRQTVVAVEAGDYAPSVYLALALAHHLGSTVEELFDHVTSGDPR